MRPNRILILLIFIILKNEGLYYHDKMGVTTLDILDILYCKYDIDIGEKTVRKHLKEIDTYFKLTKAKHSYHTYYKLED